MIRRQSRSLDGSSGNGSRFSHNEELNNIALTALFVAQFPLRPKVMKRTTRLLLWLCTICFSVIRSDALTIPASEDSYTAPRNTLSYSTSNANSLIVDATRKSYLYFDLTDIPSDAVVRWAKLRLFLPTVRTAGAGLSVHLVTGTWNESTRLADVPSISAGTIGTIPPSKMASRRFVTVDVTDTVQQWINGGTLNEGFAVQPIFRAGSPTASVMLTSKEGPVFGLPAELDIEFQPEGGVNKPVALDQLPSAIQSLLIPTPPTLTSESQLPQSVRSLLGSLSSAFTPKITSQPSLSGGLLVSAENSLDPQIKYQWLRNGLPISTGTESSLRRAGLAGGTYQVRASNTVSGTNSVSVVIPDNGHEVVFVPNTGVMFSKYETTVGQWKAFVEETGWSKSEAWRNLQSLGVAASSDNHPVRNLSWNDVQDYCAWLSTKTEKLFRLPTDAEWKEVLESKPYPWGTNWPPSSGQANYNVAEDGYPNVAPVGVFPAFDGLSDVAGNVWEWLNDGPAGSNQKYFRGGGYGNDNLWDSGFSTDPSSNRFIETAHKNADLGFRVVQSCFSASSIITMNYDSLKFPHNPIMVNSPNVVTIEFWLRGINLTDYAQVAVSRYGDFAEHRALAVGANGAVELVYAWSPWVTKTPANQVMLNGQWQHVAFCRHASGNWEIYVNGKVIHSGSGDNNVWIASVPTQILAVGGFEIDEVRWSDTDRYSGQFVPIRRFVSDQNTSLLLHFDEGDGRVIKDSGIAKQTADLPETWGWRKENELMSGLILVEGGTLPLSSQLSPASVDSFYIGSTEVTWGEWKAVRAWAIEHGYGDLAGVGEGLGHNHPVTHVNWFDVVKWCNAKSEKEGKTPSYRVNGEVYRSGNSNPEILSSATGYLLPSEAQWEFAARGGKRSNGYTYSGGNDLDTVGWYAGNAGGSVHEVGKKLANELGILDMSGNTYEWTGSWHPDYGNTLRVFRGGYWDYNAEFCKVSDRNCGYPVDRQNVGFRLATLGKFALGITLQPSVSVNGSKISVQAEGAGTLTYQWMCDGVVIAGGTSSQLSTQGLQSGTYTVVVSNGFASKTSSGLKHPSPIGVFTLVSSGTLPVTPPLEELLVDTFYIGKTEVTWGEWKTVRAWAVSNGYDDLLNSGQGAGDNYPVGGVNWYDVLKWCNARSQKEGKRPVYTQGDGAVFKIGQIEPTVDLLANGYRLPSENEWEFAARGGNRTLGYTHSGSNDFDAVGWLYQNSSGALHEVGEKLPNELGVYDMSGSFAEFTVSSWGGGRVIKGEANREVGYRGFYLPDMRVYEHNVGFRLAFTPDTVLVTGGTLSASSPLGAVPVETFYIGRTEVTWKEWKTVRDWAVINGYDDLAGVGQGVGDNYPVTHVNWYDVVKWCNARSEKEGKTPVYKNGTAVYRTGVVSDPQVGSAVNGYRLPEEKEWEFAARGGTKTNGYIYSGSNNLDEVGWYFGNSGGAAHEVGKKLANELGIFDMSCNVWEYCGSWHPEYAGLYRVLKGGVWGGFAEGYAVDYRIIADTNLRGYDYGFRVALNGAPRGAISQIVDGSGQDRITFPHDPVMNTDVAKCTIEFWAKATSVTESSLVGVSRYRDFGEDRQLFVKGNGSVHLVYAFAPYVTDTGPNVFKFDNKWHHVAFSKRENGDWRLYVDGKSVLNGNSLGTVLSAESTTYFISKGFILDEFRWSKTSRYMDDFTPTRYFESDADTLMLLHFDEVDGILVNDSGVNKQVATFPEGKWVRVTEE